MLPLRLSEIAARVGGRLVGDADPVVTGAAALADAGPGDLGFVVDAARLPEAVASAAGALLIGPDMVVDKPAVRVEDPYRAFAAVLGSLAIPLERAFPPGVHPTAVIDPDADVAAAAAIGPYCVVGAGTVLAQGVRLGAHVVLGCDVRVGRDTLIHAQAVVREGCVLGARVVVHAGVVVGSDGFGYLPGPSGLAKVPQVGIVEVQDDVELGAGVTIDRATTGRTVIGAGTKLDNQVQIAHNVRVGSHCALSAQTGVAGSSTLGDGVVCGGQVGIADHVTIGDGAQIGAQSGVISDVAPGSRLFGTPVQDVKAAFRTYGAARRVPALLVRVRELEAKLAGLEARLTDAPRGAADDQES
ncbi:UDP-3-O-(3-hydroxymyristoyl)glucosamine N-acyltransferase [bacterium]|nr:UDP-3-O-(3-hydroxymyristoyl)glucosamine N-acyltransferase [bacterium]